MKPLLFGLLTVIISTSAFAAKTYNLFDLRLLTPDYYVDSNPTLGLYVNGKLVIAGDHLILETGEVIKFKKFLGHGQNTIVVMDQSERAIRITQSIDDRSMTMFMGYIETYLFLNKLLPRKNLVHLLDDMQFKSLYALSVEWLPIEVLLFDYLKSDFNIRDQKFIELIDFLENFRGIKSVGDFTPFQIGYVNLRGWVLFDYGVGLKINTLPNPKATEILKIQEFKASIEPDVLKLINEGLSKRDQKFYDPNSIFRSCQNYLGQN